MDAVLYTGFPERFVKNHVIPKLRKLGIEVICIGNVDRPTERCVAKADLVLVMNEKMAHSRDNAIKIIASTYGKRTVYLPRKASGWRERLGLPELSAPAVPVPVNDPQEPQEINQMEAQVAPQQTGISSRGGGVMVDAFRRSGKNLDDMLKAIMQMSTEHRFGYNAMAPRLQPYFAGADLTPGRLKDFVGAVCRRADVPEWFLQWHQGNHGGRRVGGKVPAVAKKRSPKTDAAEIEALANEYAVENTTLKQTVKDLQAKLDACKQAASAGAVWDGETRRSLDALEVLANTGAIDSEVVLATVRKILKIG